MSDDSLVEGRINLIDTGPVTSHVSWAVAYLRAGLFFSKILSHSQSNHTLPALPPSLLCPPRGAVCTRADQLPADEALTDM
jgi:hypothetical protein